MEMQRNTSLPSFFWMGNTIHLTKKRGMFCRQIYLGTADIEKKLNRFLYLKASKNA